MDVFVRPAIVNFDYFFQRECESRFLNASELEQIASDAVAVGEITAYPTA